MEKNNFRKMIYISCFSIVALCSFLTTQTQWFKQLNLKRVSSLDTKAGKSTRTPSSANKTSKENNEPEENLKSYTYTRDDDDGPRRRQMQEDANSVCRSRSAVKNAANTYDDYIWKCNHPPYGVRYTDCNQYNANQMASQVRQIADQRDENEIAFVRKWRVDPTREVSCY
jgi:hypothetical protein